MTFRMVTATLAVALAVWGGGVASAQTQEQEAQEEIQDILAPAQEFVAPPQDFIEPAQGLDRALQSDLPLQGAMENAPIQQSIAEAAPPQSLAEASYQEQLDALRLRLSQVSGWEIAVFSAGLCGLFAAAWLLGSSSARRRARREYRRYPRSSGGSRLQNLEEVVASVQLGRRGGGRPSLPDPVTGREWPR